MRPQSVVNPPATWRAGDEWLNPATGFAVRVEELADDTTGERLVLIATYPAYGSAPPPSRPPGSWRS